MSPLTTPVRLDRRQRRRQETIEDILRVAVQVMAEHGAGGLTLGEVAHRMGIRPPSLYVYFDSKTALYDALFARGWRVVLAEMAPVTEQLADLTDLQAGLMVIAQPFVRWAVQNAAIAQLMLWRPVPGFTPSSDAYAPALEATAALRAIFGTFAERGQLRAGVDLDQAVGAWAVLMTGVITQHLSNSPSESFENGPFTRLLPDLVAMFADRFGPPQGRN